MLMIYRVRLMMMKVMRISDLRGAGGSDVNDHRSL
jgi:hypothetical protein